MVQIIKKISLEVSKPNLIQAIVAKQYDNNSRFLKVTLIHEGQKIEVEKNSEVSINAHRSDGAELSFEGETNDDGTVTVPIDCWMLQLEGTVKSDVSVKDADGRVLTSTSFIIEVERASYTGETLDDTSKDGGVTLIQKYVDEWLKDNPDATTTVQDGSITPDKLHKDTIEFISNSKNINDNSITPEKLHDNTKEWIRSGIVNVKDFGAKGDGHTDDTEAIQIAVASLNDGETLCFPKGHYLVAHGYHASPDKQANIQSVIQIANKKNITIDLCDSTIELIGKYDENGNIVNSDAVGYYLFDIIDCENFVIKNGTLKGDRLTHNYDKYSTRVHANGYGIFIRSLEYYERVNTSTPYDVGVQSSNVCSGDILNVKCHDFIGDGVVTRNGMSHGEIKIKDCEISNCRRQGISVLDSDVVVIDGCYIHDIGLPFTDNNGDSRTGAEPLTGIDIEPNSGTYCVNECVIKNTTIENTGSSSIVTSYKMIGTGISNLLKKLVIDNCKTQTLTLSAFTDRDGAVEHLLPIKITNSIINHHDCLKLRGQYRSIGVTNGEFINCVINSASEDIYNGTSPLFGCEFEIPIKLYNCVVNSLQTARICEISLINTTLNGGLIKTHEGNVKLHIKDCITSLFNNSIFDTTGSKGNYRFVHCSFFNCVKGVNNSDAQIKFVRCYFDTKFIDYGTFINCTIADETVDKATKDYINEVIGGIENGSY